MYSCCIILLKGGDAMSIEYKINVLASLKEKGYTTTRLRKEKLLAESTIQQLRENKLVSWKNIDRICELLGCDIGYLLERKD